MDKCIFYLNISNTQLEKSVCLCYLQQLCGGGPLLRVFHQTLLHKVCEVVRPELRLPEGRGRVGGDHEDGLRGVKGVKERLKTIC